jgi:hypothetical protein
MLKTFSQRVVIIFVFSLLSLSCEYFQLIFKGQPSTTAEVKGVVREKKTKKPIEKAKVSCGGRETFTNKKGEFLLTLVPIKYQKVKVTKEGYREKVKEVKLYPRMNVLKAIELSPGREVKGSITSSQTWSVKPTEVYYVIDTVYIERGATLTIEPGVKLKFFPHKALIVLGRLLASGTPKKKIEFIPDKTLSSEALWRGIVIEERGSAKIEHCIIRSAYEGISVREGTISLSQSEISHCKQAGLVAFQSKVTYIEDSIITFNRRWGIKLEKCLKGLMGAYSVHHNEITFNGTGIYIIETPVIIEYNTIKENKNGIECLLFQERVECRYNNICSNTSLAITGSPHTLITVTNNFINDNECGEKITVNSPAPEWISGASPRQE